jgi:hypothetical protein
MALGSIAALACLSGLQPAYTQEEAQVSTAQDRQQVSLTVYNDDLSLIRESRSVPVRDGVFRLRFEDVTSGIDPTTVHLSSERGGLSILEQNYTFDLISRATLLEKYVGRRVGYRTEDGSVGQATLLSTHQGPVYRLDDRIVFELPGPLVLDSIPGELSARPTLQWLLQGDRRGEQEVEVAYLSGGLSWRADYVLLLDEEETRADLTAWVTLDNRSGSAFRQAQLKLVAGQVHRVQEQLGRMMRATMAAPKMMDAPAQFQEEALFEYHLYSLERRTDIENNQKKQIKFFDASGIALDKTYTFHGRSEYLNRGYRPIRDTERVAVTLRFDNTRGNDLGVPIPAGILRVYKRDKQGAPQFLGENRVRHTPRDETIELEVGQAFDVVGEHRQVEYTRISDRIFEVEFEVELRNRKSEDIEVSVQEALYGDWHILESSLPHTRRDATTAVFQVPVPAGEKTVLTYRVRIER